MDLSPVDLIALLPQPAQSGAGAFDPSVISGLIRAWDFSTVSGSDVTTVAAAWGTSSALTLTGTSGTPDALASYAPDNVNMLKSTSSNSEVGSFTSTGALTNCSMAFTLAPVDAVLVPVIGGPSTSYIQFNAASGRLSAHQVKTNAGSANAANFATSASYLWPGGCYLCVITFAGATGTYTFRINGVEDTHVRGAGAVTFDRLFRQAAANVWGNGMWGVFAIWNKLLSAPEIAQIETGWTAKKAGRIFLSQAGDDTTSFGFSAATPKKTLLTALTFGGIAQRSGISLKRGEEWNEGIASTFVTSGADASNRFIFDAYGSGSSLPHLWQSVRATGWSNIGGGLWTKGSVATEPDTIWRIVDPEDKTAAGTIKFTKDALTVADYSFTWADIPDLVTIRLPAGVDPAVVDIRINSIVAAKGVDISANNISVRDLSFRFWGGEGSRPTGSNVESLRCEYSWNLGDGANCNGAAIDYKNGWCVGNGSTTLTSGQGDGFSAHGGGTGTVDTMYFEANGFGGGRDEQYSAISYLTCTFKDNVYDFLRLQQGAGSAPVAVLVSGCAFTTTSRSSTGYPAQIESGVEAGVTVTFTNNSFTNSGGSQSNHAIDVLGGTLVDGGGNTLSGYTNLHN